jgi:hypothetical protein
MHGWITLASPALRRLCLRSLYVLESLWLLLFLFFTPRSVSAPLALVYFKYVGWRGFATRAFFSLRRVPHRHTTHFAI